MKNFLQQEVEKRKPNYFTTETRKGFTADVLPAVKGVTAWWSLANCFVLQLPILGH